MEKIGRKIDILNIRRGSPLTPHILEIVRTTIRNLKIPKGGNKKKKNKQHNDQQKKDKRTNNDLQNIPIKLKFE